MVKLLRFDFLLLSIYWHALNCSFCRSNEKKMSKKSWDKEKLNEEKRKKCKDIEENRR